MSTTPKKTRSRKSVSKKSTTNKSSESVPTKATTRYKRGQLMSTMKDLYVPKLDSIRKQSDIQDCLKSIQEVDYDVALAKALETKPNSKFNKYHHSWYKNHFTKLVEEKEQELSKK